MPSATLLNEFNRFDDETLEKLIQIGDSILTPMDTELTSVDFASMLNEVFKPNGLADSHFPEWKDRSKSDFGRFLVELFALFSDKDFFYINHFSRESFVLVADLYRSIFHQAQHQGFNPPSNVSAEGNVQLLFSAGSTEFVPRGSIVLGIEDMPSLVYVNDEFTIPNSTIDQSVTITFKHGKLRREQLFFDGYSLVLDVPKIVSESIKLTIDGTVWVETDNFVNGDPSTKHFMVFYDEEGRAEIQFADEALGAKPNEGELCDIEFLVGGGYIGDITADTLDRIVSSDTTRNLISFQQFAMTGGNDLMPMELLRHTVIGKARHQNRIVTPEDAEYFCKQLSFVHKVFSDVFLNYTYIYVYPIGGGNISPAQQTLVENLILTGNEGNPFLLMGQNLTVTSPIYVPVTMSITMYLLPTTVRSGAETMALQAIDEYLNPDKNGEFGGGVKRSLLSSLLLQRVTGSQNMTFDILHRSGTPNPVADINFINQELVDVANSTITVNLVGGI